MNKNIMWLLELVVAFFINIAAGYFFAIYAAPTILEKVNALIACIACFVVAYYVQKQYKE